MHDTAHDLIPEEDARAMVALMSKVAAGNGEHEEKKRILMDGLCDLVGADFWIWGLAADYNPEEPPVYTSISSGGFGPKQVPKLLVALDNKRLFEAVRPLGREIVRLGTQVTRLPEDYDSDNAFAEESVAIPWREADIGPPLVCYRPVANNSLSSIGLYRRWESEPFSRREAKIAHIVLTEVGWLHEQGWPWESALRVPQLPHRCRMTLNLLLEGLSRKEIADRMSISVHTANDYVKHIYSFFSVHSHAELLNRFRIGDGGDMPT